MEHPIRDLDSRDGGDEEYNNICSSSVDLVGTNMDFVRHNSRRLLNKNRELPLHSSYELQSDSELNQPNGVGR
jgi:hypothetical protein